jgi:bacillaene synthase trans-acting acyltransferase
MANVFLFSGQGSQFHGMGLTLFNREPVFENKMLELDAIAETLIGYSVIEKIFNEDRKVTDPFDRTLYTHPALFMVECAMSHLLQDRGVIPSMVMGTSLGEFAACVVAGVVTEEAGLRMVIQQALAMETYCCKGSMMAILGDANLFLEDAELRTKAELVSINFDSHFVISGRLQNLEWIKSQLSDKDIICQILPVTEAFHSKSMDPAKNAFLKSIESLDCREPEITLYSCVEGREVNNIFSSYFWDAARKPILFAEALNCIASKYDNCHFIDLGPSGTLAGFVRYNLSNTSNYKTFSTITAYGNDRENIEKICNSCEMFVH